MSTSHIIQFSSVMSNSLQPHGLQHTRVPCPSPTPKEHSNSCPLSWWCHLTISSSVVPFSSCLQSFPGSGSFPVSQLFTSGAQSIGALVSVPSNECSGLISFRIDWFDLPAVQRTLKNLLWHHKFESINFLALKPSLWSNSHIHTWLLKNHSFD